MTSQRPRLAIVGGGISGLSAALFASEHGFDVTVFETQNKLGGILGSTDFGGRRIEGAADSILNRDPIIAEFMDKVGVTNDLTTTATQEAWILRNKKLRKLPSNTAIGIPRTIKSILSAQPLTLAERIQASFRVLTQKRPAPPVGAISVGEFSRHYFGDGVTNGLVAPLLGGVYAGDINQLDCQAVIPEAWKASQSAPKLLDGFKKNAIATSPAGTSPFICDRNGMTALLEATKKTLFERGVRVLQDSAVESIERDATQNMWTLRLAQGTEVFDAVAVTTPPAIAAQLLKGHEINTEFLAQWPTASVAIGLFAFKKSAFRTPPQGSGFLVAPSEETLLTACSISSSKWGHLSHPENVILRASIGNATNTSWIARDNEDLLDEIDNELRRIYGITADPIERRMVRWANSLPQYTTGHDDRMRLIEKMTTATPTLAMANNAYGGVGIASSIRHAHDQIKRLARVCH